MALAVHVRVGLAAAFVLGACVQAHAQTTQPEPMLDALFDKTCSSCHDHPDATRAPDRGALRRLSPEGIYRALTTGPMSPMAAGVPDAQKQALAEYISGRKMAPEAVASAASMKGFCGPAKGGVTGAASDWNGWGNGAADDRFQPRPGGALDAAGARRLKLAWAFGLPGAGEAYNQPTVAGGQVFVSSDSGWVYALDAKSGCARWSFQADGGVRGAAVLGKAGGRTLVFFGDIKAEAYALDARTGTLVWKTQVNDHPLGRVTGGVVLSQGRLYVPVSSHEEWMGAGSTYPCCTFSGALAALDAGTGKVVWNTRAIAEAPKPTRKNSLGVQLWGPAGAAIWGSPAIDEKRGLAYVSTGDGYTAPAAATTNAVMALDLKTGKVAWTFQGSGGDAWLGGCVAGGKNPENCPEPTGPDYDFSSGVMLTTDPDGRQLIIAGQKSGAVWALDPDRKGAVVWKTELARTKADPRGEIIWGGASDGRSVYYGLTSGGFAAVDLKDGKVRWRKAIDPAAGRIRGHGGAASVTPDLLLSGGWDGVVRALSTRDGELLWSFDTARDFKAANGVAAKGGSMGAPGPVAADGTIYVGSGIVGVQNGLPGNVLLAFRAE